ncbi:interleukin-12 subunit alpha [Dipodomys merriami]|uniref:interleukin-12 subunit alpha n=1 Tax=Dipodomys merriami TaxID=94247 RepID=UPI003855B4B7
MRPASVLLLVAALALLDHTSQARSLSAPATHAGGPHACLDSSQNLLRAVGRALQKARQTLEHYSCTAEKIGHVDITKDKTSTVEACVPLELAKNKSCLVSRETSVLTTGSCLASTEPSPEPMMILCLSSIYEDLKMYQREFKAMNAILLMDPTSEITLDKDMLTAIDALMQALNSKSETVPHQPSSEEPDLYRIRMQLCILLHAFRVRAVTIDRVMSYLSSS